MSKGFQVIHGESRTRLYKIWEGMKRRCRDPDFEYHCQKGIKVCQQWDNDYVSFSKWANANGYSDSLTIDRIDSDKDYCPTNCRWITLEENSKRATATWWKVVHVNGTEHIVYSMNEFCKVNGLKSGTMTLVAQGKNSHHKGWVCQKADTYEDAALLELPMPDDLYTVIDQQGTVHKFVINLKEFCNTNGLSSACMARLARLADGRNHKGWKCMFVRDYK